MNSRGHLLLSQRASVCRRADPRQRRLNFPRPLSNAIRSGASDQSQADSAGAPDDFEHSPDVDANLSPQFTIAGRNEIGKVKAETRDLATGALLHNAFLVPHEPIEDLVFLGLGPGVSTPSLALLVRDDVFVILESRYRVVLVDLLTGSRADQTPAQRKARARGLGIVSRQTACRKLLL